MHYNPGHLRRYRGKHHSREFHETTDVTTSSLYGLLPAVLYFNVTLFNVNSNGFGWSMPPRGIFLRWLSEEVDELAESDIQASQGGVVFVDDARSMRSMAVDSMIFCNTISRTL